MRKNKIRFPNLGDLTSKKLFLFGMLANWGLMVVSFLIFGFITKVIFPTLSNKSIPLIYLILSITVYFLIGPSKPFKYGYFLGFILGIILHIATYF